ncbi:MAG: class I SAM-dependent methyltransferase [Candidatus Eremiobacterota bacterium]
MEGYYEELMAAYVRGRLGVDGTPEELFREAGRRELRVHRFKRTAGLPRVRRVLGLLKGLEPADLLDVGTGRGVFLWPLLDEFPDLAVTCVDLRPDRVEDLHAVSRGGVERLRAFRQDVCQLDFPDGRFDVVTALEVLEHLQEPDRAAREAVRVARRFVLASAPSHEDDNPEHVQLFTRESFERLFLQAGARRVAIHYVLNHILAVVSL